MQTPLVWILRELTKGCSSFFKVVGIDPLYLIGPGGAGAHFEIDHQLREAPAIDEDYLGIDVLDIRACILGKSPRGHEDPLLGSFPVQGADELLDLRTPDGAIPFFGLDVNDIETEPIFANDTVDPFISGSADCLAGVLPGATVPHLQEKLDDELFKKSGSRSLDPPENFGGQASPHFEMSSLERLFGRLRLTEWGCLLRLLITSGPAAEFRKFGKLFEKPDVDPGKRRVENVPAPLGDPEVSSSRR